MASRVRVLSIDGGGIRGLIPARVLVALEGVLQRKTGRPEARIADYFDLVAGTSTGGILACLLLCPEVVPQGAPAPPSHPRAKYSAQDAVNLYLSRGRDIFHVPTWHRIRAAGGLSDEKYPAAGVEAAAADYFGELRLEQLVKPCLVTAYDIERRRAHFFTQHNAHVPGKNFLVRDVVRATSAAPTFFECARISSDSGVPYALVDGGVFANNPTLCAYAEVRSGWARAMARVPAPTAKDMVILSVGTGALDRPYAYEDAKDWGAIGWLRPVLDIMMAGVSETVDYQLRQIYDAVGAPSQYVRVQASLGEGQQEMDNVDPDNLSRLVQIGTETAERHTEQLEGVADWLLRET